MAVRIHDGESRVYTRALQRRKDPLNQEQSMRIIQRLRMPGVLSFPPDMDFFELQSLNVLIGSNASGKSNFIEVLGLLNALPTDFAAAIRDGGGAAEWLWKGSAQPAPATIEVETSIPFYPPLRYRLSFFRMGPGVAINDETVEGVRSEPGREPNFYYTLQQGRPVINIRVRTEDGDEERSLKWDTRIPEGAALFRRLLSPSAIRVYMPGCSRVSAFWPGTASDQRLYLLLSGSRSA